MEPLYSHLWLHLTAPLRRGVKARETAAQGYCELGMLDEAMVELEEIEPDVRHLPEILAVRVMILQGLQKWDQMQVVAKKLVEWEPDRPDWLSQLAYATRRMESLEKAYKILIAAAQKHPKDATIQFNLACYECQLGNLHASKEYLKQAIQLQPKYRDIAVHDADLDPLWEAMKTEL